MRFRACAFLIASLFGSHFAAETALAVVTRWNTNFGGNFNVGTNWDTGVPDGDDNAVFARGSGVTYTVTFPGNSLILPTATYLSNQVNIDSNNVSFVQSALPTRGPSIYAIGSYLLIADFFTDVVLNTSLGLLSTPRADIAFGPNAVGTLNVNSGTFSVTGSDSSGYDFVVGNSGTGTVNVANGGRISLTGADGNLALGANGGSHGTMNVSGVGSLVNQMSSNLAAPFAVGGSGSGTLNIMGGGKVIDFASVIAMEPGSIGSATVNGTGSNWTNSGSLVVGGSGAGTLTISGGGQVSDGDATLGGANAGSGVVDVTGAGSTWTQSLNLRVGANYGTVNGVPQFGFGTLNITDAGQTNTTGDASISALTSKATVSGGGSVWNVGGESSIDSAATLDIQAGGLVNSNTAFVSSSGDGTANVSGAGSTWNITDTLFVGRNGTGTLNVTGGGHLTSRLGFFGIRPPFFSVSSALVQIDGIGSTLTGTEQLFVGYESQALLLVTAGGQVTTGTGHLGLTSAGDGAVRVSGAGSTWTNTESLYVGVAGIGDLSVSNGGTIAVDDLLSIGPRGLVQGNSTVAAEVRNGGTVAPGVSPSFNPNDALGTLQFIGDYTQAAAGTLQIQLASTASFDKLVVDGHTTLAGTLKLSLFGGFMPAVGDMFQVLTATDGITGTFSLDFTSLSSGTGGPGWIVVYSNSDVVLKFVDFPPGDYNRNGVVDAADYIVWRGTLGSTTNLVADGNRDNMITQDDYDVWKLHFGEIAGSGSGDSSNAPVPEPATPVLLMFGAAGWFLRRGRNA